MRIRHVAPATVLLVALCAGSAVATDLTVFLGGIKPGKLTVDNVRTPLDSSPVYGFRFSRNFVPLFGMEHTFAFSSDFLFPSGVADVADANGFLYSANLIVSIPVGRVIPYLTGGAGLIRQYGSPELPVGTKLAFNYGGGVKVPRLAGPLGLRLDARGYTATNVFSDSLNLLELSGGLLISF